MTEYRSIYDAKSFQSDAGGWRHHSLSWGGSKNWQKSTRLRRETGYVSDVALANHWDWAEGQQENKDLFTVCSCVT